MKKILLIFIINGQLKEQMKKRKRIIMVCMDDPKGVFELH